jgi:hypothetical protein
VTGVWAPKAFAQAFGPRTLSEQSKQCVQCHRDQNPALYQQWGTSKHFRANVGCFECHGAMKEEPDAFEHYGQIIATLVTPKDCSRCHSKEVEEFTASHHSKAARILGSLDNVLAEVVEGNRGMQTDAFHEGTSAAAVNGCWQCHGTEVKVIRPVAGAAPAIPANPSGTPGQRGVPALNSPLDPQANPEHVTLDPATWPNTGIGRINPDGSEGSCTACHARHSFSAAQARHPDTCGKCHLGPDHPQKEIYEESKHGIAFFANLDKMNLTSEKWVVGEDYAAAPTCATCHMSATKKQPVTHDVGLRISWNNRPERSVRPEIADAALGLPTANLLWQTRRSNMTDVCLACHQAPWVAGFYTQYDALIAMYDEKFAAPGQELYKLAKPLLKQAQFSNELDWTWYELWHHEGRRARHGASMMAPDYTHWHGTYEVAKKWYKEYVPQLEALVGANINSEDPARKQAAQALQAKLDEVLSSDNHKWSVGKMDPEEAARRKKAQEDFRARYESTSAPASGTTTSKPSTPNTPSDSGHNE